MAAKNGTISGTWHLTSGTNSSKLDDMNINPVSQAIKVAGSGPKLASKLGISARAIYKWEARWDAGITAAVPASRAIEIEQATGIPRSDFRPDLWENTSEAA